MLVRRKGFGAGDGAVDVGFGGEVEDGSGLVGGECAAEEISVGDVPVDEGVVRAAGERSEVGGVAGVGEGVEVDEGAFGLGGGRAEPAEDEVGADEACAAGDEDGRELGGGGGGQRGPFLGGWTEEQATTTTGAENARRTLRGEFS